VTRLIDDVSSLRAQLIREHAQAPGLFREMAQVENLLAETYRSRVLYELLQNSDDAGSTVVRVDITSQSLSWTNDGRPFDAADIEALCRSASSTKRRGGASIGYRGIGFKAVAAVASRVEVRSAGVALRFDRIVAANELGSSLDATPLLRVPAIVGTSPDGLGSEFTLHLNENALDQLVLDPIALLFLRNVVSIQLTRHGRTETIHCTRRPGRVELRVDGRVACFHRVADGDIEVLIPADPQAESMAGRRGRFCCFLPLDDELSLPVIASGPVLTDPSRTHATLADPDTQRVLSRIGAMVGQLLVDVKDDACQRLWELLVQGEDLRGVVLEGSGSIGARVLTGAKAWLSSAEWPFSFSEVPLEEVDVQEVFPNGAPVALYRESVASAARGLRTVFGAPTLRAGDLAATADPSRFSDATRTRLARRLVESARVEGRSLTAAEQAIVGKVPRPVPVAALGQPAVTSTAPGAQATGTVAESFSGAIARWRAAEIAVMEHLNQRGWKLTDVSRQNVGYDLDGLSADGHPVHVEVKKVESKDSRFALTNNEMSVMVGASSRYLLAIVIGDGPSAQMAILDPLLDQVPRERVCRRWEWEYTDWSRFVEFVS
jgi:hypothetical protein